MSKEVSSFKDSSRLSWKTSVSMIFVYSMLTVLMTWPMVMQLDAHLFGQGSDAWSHFWVFWWVKDALLNGHSAYVTDLLYHPVGVPLYTQNIAWINIVIWLGIQLFTGDLAAYNLTFMAVYVFNAISMFWLIYVLLKEQSFSRNTLIFSAFLGGLIYGFWPYILRHNFHPNLSLTASIPLSMLFLYRTIRYRKWRDVILSGLFIGVIGLTRWQLLVMALFIVIPFVLYQLYRERDTLDWALIRKLVVANGLAIMLMLPLLIPIANYQINRTFPEDIFFDQQEGAQTDLLAYVLPSHAHPLWGDAMYSFYDGLSESIAYTPFIGFVTLLLAFFGILRKWRFSRFWFFLALWIMVMALGPTLQVNGRLFPGILMPYTFIEDIPLIRLLRKTDRLNVLLGIPIAMLAAVGTATLLANRQRWQRWLITITLSCLILFEYTVFPFPSQDAHVPLWYTDVLAKEPEGTAVMELPLQPRELADKQHMYYQTIHRHPIAGGHLSRIPREAYQFIETSALLRSLDETGLVNTEITDVTHELEKLADAGFPYLLLNKRLIDGAYRDSVQSWITIEPIYEDDDVVVYSTQPKAGEDFVIEHMFTPEIGLIRANFMPQSLPQAGTVQIDARWGATTAVSENLHSCYTLLDEANDIVQQKCTPISSEHPTDNWQKNDVVNSDVNLSISPYLPAGTYLLTLSLQIEIGESVGEATSLGFVEVAARPRLFDAPEPAISVDAVWPVGVRLSGYEKAIENENLLLRLYWQAEKRPDADLVVFVHLLDEAGNLVAQHDAVPLANTYPLTWWEADELVIDEIPLSLKNLPPNTYRLMVGLYDRVTGQRMDVQIAEADILDNAVLLDLLILTEE